MNIQNYVKNSNYKNKDKNVFNKVAGQVISYAYTTFVATKIERYKEGSTSQPGKAIVTWQEAYERTEVLSFKNDESESFPNTNKSAYVIYDRENNETFVTQNLDVYNQYSQIKIDENGQETKLKYNGTEVVIDNVNYAVVRIFGKDNLDIVLPNKSGSMLSYGDDVWVHYWSNIASGYIALNNMSDNNFNAISFINNIEVGRTTFNSNGTTNSSRVFINYQKPHSNPKVFVQLRLNNTTDETAKGIVSNVYYNSDGFMLFIKSTDYYLKSETSDVSGEKYYTQQLKNIPSGNYIVDYFIIDM